MSFSDRSYFGGATKVKAPIGESQLELNFSSPLLKYETCLYDLESVNGAYEGVKIEATLNGIVVNNINISQGAQVSSKDGYFVGNDSYGGTQEENGVCFKVNASVDKIVIKFLNKFSSRSTLYWVTPGFTFEGDNSFCEVDDDGCEAVFNKCDLCSPDGTACISCDRKKGYVADFG